MTQDNLLECRFGDGLDDYDKFIKPIETELDKAIIQNDYAKVNSVGIQDERLTLTVKGLQQIIDTAKAIEREEISLMLLRDSADKNSTTRGTIERLVDLIRCRRNK